MSLCVTLGEFHFSNLLDFTKEEFSALPSKNKVADERSSSKSSKKILQMEAGQPNKYDITKTSEVFYLENTNLPIF